jgi:hypothetical protein
MSHRRVQWGPVVLLVHLGLLVRKESKAHRGYRASRAFKVRLERCLQVSLARLRKLGERGRSKTVTRGLNVR